MGHLTHLCRERETSMCIRSLFMSYEINYEFYKETTKFNKLNSIYCIQMAHLGWKTKINGLKNEI